MLEDILQALHPETYLCIATDITLPTGISKREHLPGKKKISIYNRPSILLSTKCSFVALLIICTFDYQNENEIKKTFSYLY
jgi:hypothetical protein